MHRRPLVHPSIAKTKQTQSINQPRSQPTNPSNPFAQSGPQSNLGNANPFANLGSNIGNPPPGSGANPFANPGKGAFPLPQKGNGMGQNAPNPFGKNYMCFCDLYIGHNYRVLFIIYLDVLLVILGYSFFTFSILIS